MLKNKLSSRVIPLKTSFSSHCAFAGQIIVTSHISTCDLLYCLRPCPARKVLPSTLRHSHLLFEPRWPSLHHLRGGDTFTSLPLILPLSCLTKGPSLLVAHGQSDLLFLRKQSINWELRRKEILFVTERIGSWTQNWPCDHTSLQADLPWQALGRMVECIWWCHYGCEHESQFKKWTKCLTLFMRCKKEREWKQCLHEMNLWTHWCAENILLTMFQD